MEQKQREKTYQFCDQELNYQ